MAAIDGSVAKSRAHDALLWMGIFAESLRSPERPRVLKSSVLKITGHVDDTGLELTIPMLCNPAWGTLC